MFTEIIHKGVITKHTILPLCLAIFHANGNAKLKEEIPTLEAVPGDNFPSQVMLFRGPANHWLAALRGKR